MRNVWASLNLLAPALYDLLKKCRNGPIVIAEIGMTYGSTAIEYVDTVNAGRSGVAHG